jgi:hypothetical protein
MQACNAGVYGALSGGVRARGQGAEQGLRHMDERGKAEATILSTKDEIEGRIKEDR